MDNNRLTKKILMWDRELNEANLVFSWSSELKSIFDNCDMSFTYNCNEFPLKQTIFQLKKIFIEQQKTQLKEDCESKDKLRTFVTFKDFDSLPCHVSKPVSFVKRRFISKLRTGCLPIRIETGRFSRPRLLEHDRICLACINNVDPSIVQTPKIENEFHFLFICNRYESIRNTLFSKLQLPDDFEILPDFEKLKAVLNEEKNVSLTAQFIVDAYRLRSKIVN